MSELAPNRMYMHPYLRRVRALRAEGNFHQLFARDPSSGLAQERPQDSELSARQGGVNAVAVDRLMNWVEHNLNSARVAGRPKVRPKARQEVIATDWPPNAITGAGFKYC